MNFNKGEEEETIEDVTVTQDIIETEETLEDIEFKKKTKPATPPAEEAAAPEEKFIFKLPDCHVKKHDEAVFELKLPKPKTKVRWMKDGVPITADDKFKIDVSFNFQPTYFLFFLFWIILLHYYILFYLISMSNRCVD